MTDTGTLLFIGDSITDANRDRLDPLSIGNGFVSMIQASQQVWKPPRRWRILNRGISGNRVENLLERWDHDALSENPDVLTLMIGINNTIHRFKRNLITTTDDFAASYRQLLQKATDTNPELHVVTMEQFLLPVEKEEGSPAHHPVCSRWKLWREDLDSKIEAVRRLAVEFGTIHIMLDRIFTEAAAERPSAFWLPDGVHPSAAGHALIASAWVNATHELIGPGRVCRECRKEI